MKDLVIIKVDFGDFGIIELVPHLAGTGARAAHERVIVPAVRLACRI